MYKVWKNGTKVSMSYADICKDLGFLPEVGFVRVTTAGTITFRCGKPYEISLLYKAVIKCGYRPSYALSRIMKR